MVRTAGNGAPMMAEGVPAGSILDGSGSAEHEKARETKNINMSSDNMKWKGNWQISKEEVWKYEYDRQGNLLKDNHAEYSYDGFNRMEKAETFTGKIQVNHYDAEGLRHEMEENGRLVSFIFSAREVVAEREKESTIRYIRGYDIVCSDSECARMYYHYVCDEGGSTSHVLDETGKVLNQYEYDAFGNLIKVQEEVNNRFLYVGQQYDAVTMQYYLRARYYNPVVARFTQEDTYRGDGLNLYAYCRNNPVGYYDPSGYDTCGDSKSGSTKNLNGAINNGQPLDNHKIVPNTEASSLDATKHPPNSSADLLNPDGSVKQRRYYDADGRAQMDIDFNHIDDGTHEFPHIHIWDWSKKPPRQDSRN